MIVITYMGESFPECPVSAVDRDAMRDFLARQVELGNERAKLQARSFGQRIFRSGDVRYTISRLKRELAAAQSLHPELFTTENTEAYQQWVDSLSED